MSIIIAVDGPAGAGKGTLAHRLASYFSFPLLETGLLYRAVALKIIENNNDPYNEVIAGEIAQTLAPKDLEDPNLRRESVGNAASLIATYAIVREHLLKFQRDFAHTPPNHSKGAIIDGRDIGTVVLPEANFKLFITASLEIRAQRRFQQLQNQRIPSIYENVLEDMRARDLRDKERSLSPLKPAIDALVIDTSTLTPDEVFTKALTIITL